MATEINTTSNKNYEINQINQVLDANAKHIGFSLIYINIQRLKADHGCFTESLKLFSNKFDMTC
jgi:hypothetical protein